MNFEMTFEIDLESFESSTGLYRDGFTDDTEDNLCCIRFCSLQGQNELDYGLTSAE